MENKEIKKRNGFLDLLKFVFALIIVIGHGDTTIGTLSKEKLIPLASFGVDFFFIVSGAMMLRSFEKQKNENSISQDTLNFMKHKIKGLLPNYYVAWIILFVIGSFGQTIKDILWKFIGAIPELLFLDMSGLELKTINGNTWYISAMLIALLIVYPIARKNKEFFVKYIAPITFIFGLGYLVHDFKTVMIVKEWNGLLYYGLIRGIIEICAGCVIYELSKQLKKIKFTKLGKTALTIIEISLYVITILLLRDYDFRYNVYDLVFLIMIAVCITLSDTSYSKDLFSGKWCNWLGKYSFSLYLAHPIAYCGIIGDNIFKNNLSYSQTITLYLIIAALFGLAVMYISEYYSKLSSKYKKDIKKLFIEQEVQ